MEVLMEEWDKIIDEARKILDGYVYCEDCKYTKFMKKISKMKKSGEK